MSTRRNLSIMFAVFALIVVALGIALVTRQFTSDISRPNIEIPVDGQVSLRYYDILTPTKKEITLGKSAKWAGLYKLIPSSLKRRFPSLRPTSGRTIQTYSSSPATCVLLMEATFPPEWLNTMSAYQVTEKINTAIQTAKMRRVRFVTPSGIKSDDTYLYPNLEDWSYASGSAKPSRDSLFYYVRIELMDLPVFEKELKLQFLGENNGYQDDENVIREFTIPNPLFQVVAQVKSPASPFPVVVKDKAMEVT